MQTVQLEDRELIKPFYQEAIMQNDEIVYLSTAQLEMLKMSEDDIENGRIVSDKELQTSK